MIIQDMQNPGELSLHQSVRRMYMIASFMQTYAIQALASSDPDLAMYVSGRDGEVDRLYLHIEKQLRIILRSGQAIDSQKYMTPDMSLDLSLAGRHIERIANHARKIAFITISLNKHLPADIARMLGDALHLRIISDIIDRIGEYGANIAEIAINSTISKSV